MRRLALLLLIGAPTISARAVEVDAEVVGGTGFLYATTNVKQALLDDRLTLGAGYALVSDLHAARHGARALAELELGPFGAGLLVGWAPPQGGRGWAELELGGSHRLERGRVAVENRADVLLRRADLGVRAAVVPVGQLQLRLSSTLTVDERWHVETWGALSFYDHDLDGRALRGAELGALVTMGGRPERWALGVRGGRLFRSRWRVEGGLGWMALAAGRGGAWLPRLALRSGPWRWFTVEASLELASGGEARGPPVRWFGGLAFEVAP
jgi:hypothetical protein